MTGAPSGFKMHTEKMTGASFGFKMADGDLNKVVGKDCQITQEVMRLQSPDVVEIYSPPRVTQHAGQYNLKPGWSLDLTTMDENGEPWDFSKVHMKNKA
eukprot:2432936-Karenia_brevis.AAC.1